MGIFEGVCERSRGLISKLSTRSNFSLTRQDVDHLLYYHSLNLVNTVAHFSIRKN